MTAGKAISDEKKTLMRRLKKQGLTASQVSQQLGVSLDRVYAYWGDKRRKK